MLGRCQDDGPLRSPLNIIVQAYHVHSPCFLSGWYGGTLGASKNLKAEVSLNQNFLQDINYPRTLSPKPKLATSLLKGQGRFLALSKRNRLPLPLLQGLADST